MRWRTAMLWVAAAAIAGATLLLTSGCASMGTAYHKYVMRGQILEVTGDEVYLCIGSRDGARVGDELEVVKFSSAGGNPKAGPMFRRDKTGMVRITAIVDEHYARATIISGRAGANSVVELERH